MPSSSSETINHNPTPTEISTAIHVWRIIILARTPPTRHLRPSTPPNPTNLHHRGPQAHPPPSHSKRTT
ncbi:hypothetical protein BD410DRAFT_786517 [Rickenella mellea]|uniref:Uncharacterized protein n=1 Tax=Rickenella mellea TaxID=50990 RepID=A0A4Y7QBE3_9AGAM|nr:hypothetical protein BD410DRAFT_786517 [Rickenella mellea]